MDRSERKRLRVMSKALLSSGYQAELGAAIADSSASVWGDQLVGQGNGGPSKSIVSGELKRLRQLGLIVPDPAKPRFDRRNLFVRTDPKSPYWRLCQELRTRARRVDV